MDNDQVIATAREAAAKSLAASAGKPQAVLAFNCAGRRGKLKRPADELEAIQAALGKDCPCSAATAPAKSGRWMLPRRTPTCSAAAAAGT